MIYKWTQPNKQFTSFVSEKYNNLTYLLYLNLEFSLIISLGEKNKFLGIVGYGL